MSLGTDSGRIEWLEKMVARLLIEVEELKKRVGGIR